VGLVVYRAAMVETSVPALAAPPRRRDNPLTRSLAGVIGLVFLGIMLVASLGTLPWTLGTVEIPGGEGGQAVESPRFSAQETPAARLPPSWVPIAGDDVDSIRRLNRTVDDQTLRRLADRFGTTPGDLLMATEGDAAAALRDHWRTEDASAGSAITGFWLLGTDKLGRSLLVRVLAGGGISLTIGIAAALIAVVIGTVYGSIAAYAGGKVDGVMMRIVDILYGLPYILLVVLLAVASDAVIDEYISRERERSAWVLERARSEIGGLDESSPRDAVEAQLAERAALTERLEAEALERIPPRQIGSATRTALDVLTLLVAIGGVSWLTLARVVRGQVLSLKNQPFVEAARAMGAPVHRIFLRHLFPNLVGPVVVYATLAVPQAILQESFLSFLGIGVQPPLPSWGNLVADGLSELNMHRSRWWLLLFPSLLLGSTLLALNFVGEGLREAFDPRRARA